MLSERDKRRLTTLAIVGGTVLLLWSAATWFTQPYPNGECCACDDKWIAELGDGTAYEVKAEFWDQPTHTVKVLEPTKENPPAGWRNRLAHVWRVCPDKTKWEYHYETPADVLHAAQEVKP